MQTPRAVPNGKLSSDFSSLACFPAADGADDGADEASPLLQTNGTDLTTRTTPRDRGLLPSVPLPASAPACMPLHAAFERYCFVIAASDGPEAVVAVVLVAIVNPDISECATEAADSLSPLAESAEGEKGRRGGIIAIDVGYG